MGYRAVAYFVFFAFLVSCQAEFQEVPKPLAPLADDSTPTQPALEKNTKKQTQNKDQAKPKETKKLTYTEKIAKAWAESGINKKMLQEYFFNPETCVLNFKTFYGCFKVIQKISGDTYRLSLLDVQGLSEDEAPGPVKENLGLFSLYSLPELIILSPDNFLSMLNGGDLQPLSKVEIGEEKRRQAQKNKQEIERIKELYENHFSVFKERAQEIVSKKMEVIAYQDAVIKEFDRRSFQLLLKYSQYYTDGNKDYAAALNELINKTNRHLEEDVLPFQKQEWDQIKKNAALPLRRKIFDQGAGQYFHILENHIKNMSKNSHQSMVNLLNLYLKNSSDGHASINLPMGITQKLEGQKTNDDKSYGLGLQILPASLSNKAFIFVRPKTGSLAEQFGIQANDILLEIKNIKGNNIQHIRISDLFNKMDPEKTRDQVIHHLRGPKDSIVTLRLKSWKTKAVYEVNLQRSPINTLPLFYQTEEWNNKKYGIIHLYSFMSGVNAPAPICESIQSHIQSFDHQVDGWVLNLKGNLGGYMAEAACIADLFLEKGLKIVTTGKKQPEENTKWEHISKSDPITKKNLTVIIDEGSASASEIFAGVIQDHARGLIVGETSYGKGSVQSINIKSHPLHKKWQFFWGTFNIDYRETIGYYYLPSGRTPQWYGVQPDIKVLETPTQQAYFKPREQHNFPLSLPPSGKQWEQTRPQEVQSVQECVAGTGKANEEWSKMTKPFREAYSVYYAMEALTCMAKKGEKETESSLP